MKKLISLLILLSMTTFVYAEDVGSFIRKKPDEALIKTMTKIYNLDIETRGDEIAKNISLDEFMKVAKSRQSHKIIKESGILSFQYEKINVKKMSDQDLVNTGYYLYNNLPEERLYSAPKAKLQNTLSEKEKDTIGIRTIASLVISKEIGSRTSCRKFWNGFGQLVGSALVATSDAINTHQAYRQQRAIAAASRPIQPIEPVGLVTSNQTHTTVQRDYDGNITGWTTQ